MKRVIFFAAVFVVLLNLLASVSAQEGINENSINRLKLVVNSSETTTIEKENAILEMAQFAIILDDPSVIDYLKEIAVTSDDEDVVAAAYAAIDLLRDHYPIEPIGEMDISVDGEIKPNSKIVFRVNIKTLKKCEGGVGIRNLPTDFQLISDRHYYKFRMEANEDATYTFEIIPKKTGDYFMTIGSVFAINRFDDQRLLQKLLIRVNETGGEVIKAREKSPHEKIEINPKHSESMPEERIKWETFDEMGRISSVVLIPNKKEGKVEIEVDGAVATTEEEIKIDKSNLYVGGKIVRITPKTAISKATESERIVVEKSELKTINERPTYIVRGSKETKVLWFIPLTMNVEVNVDAESGEITKVSKPWWSFLASR